MEQEFHNEEYQYDYVKLANLSLDYSLSPTNN